MKKISFRNHPVYFLLIFIVLFFLILSSFNRFLFTPKILLLCLIVFVAVYLGKIQIFYRDWFVFLAFIYLFDSLRGTIYILTCKLHLPVYVLYIMKAEKFLFGEIPSIALQQALLNKENITWLEKFLTIIHGTHFVAFLFVGLIVWLYKSDYFRSFKVSFYLVTFIGVSFYFIIPTAPPWLAFKVFHALPEIIRFNVMIYNMSIPDITAGFSTNPIGAMPSLHAAFPILCSLILWRLFRWKASIFFLYTFLILFTIVYTGDHYIVDIIAGAALSLICYSIAFQWGKFSSIPNSSNKLKIKKNKFRFLKQHRVLFIGASILIFGISIGLANKNQFRNHYLQYDYFHAPNYIDFFKHEDKYQENYRVQFYFGNYYLSQKQYEKALFYFEHAMTLTDDFIDKKRTLIKIEQCRTLLDLK